jgi:hypothetical protein
MSQVRVRPLKEVKLVWVGDQVRVTGGLWRDDLKFVRCEVRMLSQTNLAQAFCVTPSGFTFAAHVEDLELIKEGLSAS